jgi:lysophospholipase L1-like esterase
VVSLYPGANKITVCLAANTPVYLPINVVMQSTAGGFTAYANSSTAANENITISVSLNLYTTNDDNRSGKIIRWIGDSTAQGVGLSTTDQQYQRKFIDRLRFLGKYVKSEIQGFSGTNSNAHIRPFESGHYEDDESNLAAFFVGLGINDSGVNGLLSTAVYKANMKSFANRMLNLPRFSGPVVLVGATPIGINISGTNDYDTSGAVAQRASLFEIITEINNPRLFAINPSINPVTSAVVFDRNNTGFLPDKIHPNSVGTQAIFDNCFVPWLGTAEGISFLSQLPV